MKAGLAFAPLTIISLFCQAQIEYRPGYFIRNDSTKVSCLIKDYDWRNNPTGITWKSVATGTSATMDRDSILEFGVGNAVFRRFEIDVDVSAGENDDPGNSPLPTFQRETVLLKLLVQGRASLYRYSNKGLTLFYMVVNNPTPQPLVYKQFLSQSNLELTNTGYITQLQDSLRCTAPGFPDPAAVRYEERSLVRFFVAFNNCTHSAVTDYSAKTSGSPVHPSIRAGIDLTSLTLDDQTGSVDEQKNLGNKLSFRIGAELEIPLNFNRNKWAVVVEPAYRYYSAQTAEGSSGFQVNYRAIQLGIGGRYYLFSGPSSRWLLTGLLVADFPVNSSVEYLQESLRVRTHAF